MLIFISHRILDGHKRIFPCLHFQERQQSYFYFIFLILSWNFQHQEIRQPCIGCSHFCFQAKLFSFPSQLLLLLLHCMPFLQNCSTSNRSSFICLSFSACRGGAWSSTFAASLTWVFPFHIRNAIMGVDITALFSLLLMSPIWLIPRTFSFGSPW